MKLLLMRDTRGNNFTGGKLYAVVNHNWVYLCDTLEDKWRDLMGILGKVEYKKYGETCIPEGEYEISLERSEKYTKKFHANPNHALAFTEGIMPRIKKVPFFEGILLHSGNTIESTEGCVLLGQLTPKGTIKGGTSTPAFKKVYQLLKTDAEQGIKNSIDIQSLWTVEQ